MKASLKTAVLALFAILPGFAAGNLQGQEIPKGSYTAQPAYFDGSATIRVEWLESAFLWIELDHKGVATNLLFNPGKTDFQYEYSTGTPTEKPFKHPATWLGFAKQVVESFRSVGDPNDELYVEAAPYKVVGMSLTMSSFETPTQNRTIIFKRDEKWLAVALDKWKGELPAEGTMVLVGQCKNGEYFFPVSSDNRPPKELLDQLASDKEENRKHVENLRK